jgi:hypothetical protein
MSGIGSDGKSVGRNGNSEEKSEFIGQLCLGTEGGRVKDGRAQVRGGECWEMLGSVGKVRNAKEVGECPEEMEMRCVPKLKVYF